VRIGALNKTIVLQSKTEVDDGMGAFTSTWGDEYTVKGAIWPVTGKEMIQNSALTSTISHKIQIRYLPDVKATWRVKYGTRLFNILSVINQNERNRVIDLICKEDQ